uniref:Polyketide synthase n=1 Tax=Peronospora matthiolae TaxID=2874970 RepID=A0AAV1TNE1_9STRA
MPASGGDGVIAEVVISTRKCERVTASCCEASFRLSAVATLLYTHGYATGLVPALVANVAAMKVLLDRVLRVKLETQAKAVLCEAALCPRSPPWIVKACAVWRPRRLACASLLKLQKQQHNASSNCKKVTALGRWSRRLHGSLMSNGKCQRRFLTTPVLVALTDSSVGDTQRNRRCGV